MTTHEPPVFNFRPDAAKVRAAEMAWAWNRCRHVEMSFLHWSAKGLKYD